MSQPLLTATKNVQRFATLVTNCKKQNVDLSGILEQNNIAVRPEITHLVSNNFTVGKM